MVVESNSTETSDKFEDPCKSTEDNEIIITQANEASPSLYQAIKDKKLDDIKLLLQDERLVNAPLFTSGPLAGYTALHVACMEENEDLVEMLVKDYHADVNIVAEDKTQPIHLACLFDQFKEVWIVHILLAANADVEAELERDIFLKYTEGGIWCDDFGDTITLLTHTILHDKSILAEKFLCHDANSKFISRTNKTLLMYATEKMYSFVPSMILSDVNEDIFNARDDDGFHALHFPIHPKKYGDYRYDGNQAFEDDYAFSTLESLVKFDEIDLYATVNGDPATLIFNMAAYRSSPGTLGPLLPYLNHLKGSRALYYATLPPEDPEKIMRLHPNVRDEDQWRRLEENKKESIELILKDLINRMSFGLPVPEEEKKLMDKLIETDKDIRELVHNYKHNFIHGELKNIVIHYGDKTMTYYDFIFHSIDDKKTQLLVRNKVFMEGYSNTNLSNTGDHYYFKRLCYKRIDNAIERIELLDKLKKVEHLTKAIPLPYECILDIIEYLNNKNLEVFIDSFYDV